MPKEQQSRREVLAAIQALPSLADLTATHDGHFAHELDLEVIVYGRNYNGKKVGPYVRLLNYDPNEVIIREGDWGGNTFYVVVDGRPEVHLRAPDGSQLLVATLPPGRQFGEMSVLAGVPRSATVKAPAGGPVRVLEVQRPALRLLRKLSKFGEGLESAYQFHGRNSAYQEMRISTGLGAQLVAQEEKLSWFRVFARNHLLFHEGDPIEWIYVIKEGWLRRGRGGEAREFLGSGYCFGLEGVRTDARWAESVTLMGRTEVLMISIAELRVWPALLEGVLAEMTRFAAPPLAANARTDSRVTDAQEKLIHTGLVDGTNLLVMDMDLCVRCGRCSMACHQIHGQSRLLRRGIHLTRLEGRKSQQVLAPAVCLHCQDPECLTGCPTGAIGRFSQGQIDINPKTCIGCGDCATNCPYNAISMVARKPAPAPTRTWRDRFRFRPEPLPPPVEQAEDLLAVKCNLCSGTPLNPPNSRRAAYGCEENCPTGALARINPREYFGEIGQLEGLAYRDETHAVGRNLHLDDPPRRWLHGAGILLTLALTAAVGLGLRRSGFGAPLVLGLNLRWVTGLIGLAGIIGVMLYPARRQVFRRRAGPLRYWMLAHSYLGVIAGVMLLLHGGAHPGGALTTALMLSFDAVILTGLFGIVCYVIAPRLLTRIEGDPLLIDDLKLRREELRQELTELAARSSGEIYRVMTEQVVPWLGSFAYGLRQFRTRQTLEEMLAEARERFRPALAGASSDEARGHLSRIIDSLATLRRVEALILLHRALRIWLPPHVLATSAMLALLVIHLIQVLWGWR